MFQVCQKSDALIGHSGTFPTLHHSFATADVSPLTSVVSHHNNQGGNTCNF